MTQSVAIIGAGLAGAVCARALADAGHAVTVFEKSGGTGGRLSTRRNEAGSFDHGAQYLTARGAPMRALLDELAEKGAAAPWVPEGKDRAGDWHVGLPGMSGLVKPLLDGIDVRLRTPVDAIGLDAQGHVRLTDAEGRDYRFGRVVVTAPAPQAMALTLPLDPVFEALDAIVYAPCWAGMFALDEPAADLPDVLRGDDDGPAALIVRNSSKPGRAGETFIVHGGGAWSARHLESEPDLIVPRLLGALEHGAARRLSPVHAVAHRWRYARVDRALGEDHLMSDCGRIIVCGDGLVGGRAEAAAHSGWAAAAAILDRQAPPCGGYTI
ncbi:MAG: FAD-dependent oxidoreductase [Roseitalea sp.]|jgi:predicted NAD/FAD-dependent oxidoreductase|nr:FAD-dependent oxidoreductase [Roseitalea sp.]MBO6722423.1 FAD-dependent oxidoreductase [Roseitalea sp.]MBO6741963.1 FAD-dependent oxidoreductase [Roseitalea sp.]